MRVTEILAGKVEPLGERQAPSAIAKVPVRGKVRVGPEGLECDAQGDRKVHGGPEKAIHHYAFDHYAAWRARIGDNPLLQQPGAFGENFSSLGLTEKDVAVGDTFRLGSTVLQVSQGRQPCWKLNYRFGVPDMSMQVQQSGMTGWYYRVLEAGEVEAGDELLLIDRVEPLWTIERLWRALFVDTMNLDELAALIAAPHLPEKQRIYAERRLATRKVESWNKRLTGSE